MKIGFVAGAFDLLHLGHIHLLKQCKTNCDHLIVALHVDPSIERSYKNKPIESLYERFIKLKSIKFVDQIIVYETEKDLSNILKMYSIDIRFLGSDYNYEINDDDITEKDLIPIKYINSLPIHSSDIRERIKK